MNAEGVWPASTLKMFLTFFALFRQKKEQLFQSYQDQDGEFHGAEPNVRKRGMSQLSQEELDELSSESENSFEREFV